VACVFDAASNVEYVAVDNGAFCTKEDLWEQLKQSLLAELARRMVKPRKGRRPRGPGASLGDEPVDRARVIRQAYDKLSIEKGRPPQYKEIAREVHVSIYSLWRFRNTYPEYGWPPQEGAA